MVCSPFLPPSVSINQGICASSFGHSAEFLFAPKDVTVLRENEKLIKDPSIDIMVVTIQKDDQDKVTCAIEWMERELQELHFLFSNIAQRSKENGSLEVGDTVEIVKAVPDSAPVVKCAVVILLEYCIHNLKVQAKGSTSEGTLVVEDLDIKGTSIRRVVPGDGGDDSDGSVSYHDEENYIDTN